MNNKILLSEIEEIGAEVGEPDCKLINPVTLTTTEEKLTVQEGKVVLTKWFSSLTKDREFMISSDKILTMADPAPTIMEKYMDLSSKP
tara:strand:- start:1190 stop:1453 length:264 start_codon:yes stop_codon:yes gene_type:complete